MNWGKRKAWWDLKTDHPNKVVRITLKYEMGETKEKRGYWLVITPVEKEGMWETVVAYSGMRTHYDQVNSYQEVTFDGLVEALDKFIEVGGEGRVMCYARQVALENGLILEGEGNGYSETETVDGQDRMA